MNDFVKADLMFDSIAIYPIGVDTSGAMSIKIDFLLERKVVATRERYGTILGQYGLGVDMDTGNCFTIHTSPQTEWTERYRYGTAFCGEMVDSLRLEPARLRKGGKR